MQDIPASISPQKPHSVTGSAAWLRWCGPRACSSSRNTNRIAATKSGAAASRIKGLIRTPQICATSWAFSSPLGCHNQTDPLPAVCPGPVANAIRVPSPDFISARPVCTLTLRGDFRERSFAANGLWRQASRNTSLTLASPMVWSSARSMLNVFAANEEWFRYRVKTVSWRLWVLGTALLLQQTSQSRQTPQDHRLFCFGSRAGKVAPIKVLTGLVPFLRGVLKCWATRGQITVEPEPSGFELGLMQRSKYWLDISPGLGVETNRARKVE